MEQDPESDYLSLDEFGDQLKKLSFHDVARILYVAKLKYISGTGMTDDELLSEAIARVLEGSRHLPRNVPIVASLIETIRSISSIERGKAKRQKEHMGVEVSVESSEGEVSSLQNAYPSPDTILEENQEDQYREGILKELDDIVAEDPHGKAYLNGKLNELTAKEVIQKTPMTPQEYGAARKRFTRALLRIKPKRN